MNIRYLCAVCIVLLLIGVPSWLPYGFYVLLRWVISVASIFVAYRFYKSKLQGWAIVFGIVCLLFNPISPVYLSKGTWVFIDIVASVLFFLTGFSKTRLKVVEIK